jgi:hypothetical protein
MNVGSGQFSGSGAHRFPILPRQAAGFRMTGSATPASLTVKAPRLLSAASARTPKPSGGHSTANGLVTNTRGRVPPGDAAGPHDEAAALGDEKAPAGRIQHPPDKP